MLIWYWNRKEDEFRNKKEWKVGWYQWIDGVKEAKLTSSLISTQITPMASHRHGLMPLSFALASPPSFFLSNSLISTSPYFVSLKSVHGIVYLFFLLLLDLLQLFNLCLLMLFTALELLQTLIFQMISRIFENLNFEFEFGVLPDFDCMIRCCYVLV